MRTWTLALILVLLAGRSTFAQEAVGEGPAFELDRFVMRPGPGMALGSFRPQVLSKWRWHTSLAASFLSRPIVLRELGTNEEVSVPVQRRLGLQAAAALGLGNGWQVGVVLPLVLAQSGDRLQGIDLDERSLAPSALGDLRVHLRLATRGRDDTRVGVDGFVALPSGADEHFAGEAGPIVGVDAALATRASSWDVVLNAGLRLRWREVVFLSPARSHGNEVLLSAATRRGIGGPWAALLEASAVLGDGGGPSPKELRAGVEVHATRRSRLSVGVGGGVGREQTGAPRLRLFAVWNRALR